MFDSRVIEPEYLDHAAPEVARANLADLVRLNKRFGGHSTLRYAFDQVVSPEERFSVLDVGAASGDSARFLTAAYPGARVISLDLHPVNLESAPSPKLIADAFELPFADGSFDVVMSSLFLHHFSNERVRGLLDNFHRLARRAVVICDLERHFLPAWFLVATKKLFGWGEITVHDGLASFRAAFSKGELEQVAREAGMQGVRVRAHRPAFRLSLVCRK